MNKFAVQGLMLEAIGGRRVLAVCYSPGDVRDAMGYVATAEFLNAVFPYSQFRNASGRTQVDYPSGGSIRFLVASRESVSGLSADTVFIDSEVEMADWYRWASPVIATSPRGQIVRA